MVVVGEVSHQATSRCPKSDGQRSGANKQKDSLRGVLLCTKIGTKDSE